MNKSEAIKATKNGAIAGYISGTVTTCIAFAAFYTGADSLQYWNDPILIFDILLIFICAFGVQKKSRTAALALLAYFILSKILLSIELNKVSGLGISLVFMYFFARATQGTFVYHKLEKSENPDYKSTSKLVLWLGIPFGVIFCASIGFGLLTMSPLLPSTEVLPSHKIYDQDKQTLLQVNVIDEGDEIEFFYSEGTLSILEGGTVLTKDKLITYIPQESEGQVGVYELSIKEITSLELIHQGSYLSDSLYQANTNDPERWIQFLLSTENAGDQKFIKALKSKMKQTP